MMYSPSSLLDPLAKPAPPDSSRGTDIVPISVKTKDGVATTLMLSRSQVLKVQLSLETGDACSAVCKVLLLPEEDAFVAV